MRAVIAASLISSMTTAVSAGSRIAIIKARVVCLPDETDKLLKNDVVSGSDYKYDPVQGTSLWSYAMSHSLGRLPEQC